MGDGDTTSPTSGETIDESNVSQSRTPLGRVSVRRKRHAHEGDLNGPMTLGVVASDDERTVTLPYRSQAQRGHMHVHHPEIAKRWDKETPKGKKLPKKLGKSRSRKKR